MLVRIRRVGNSSTYSLATKCRVVDLGSFRLVRLSPALGLAQDIADFIDNLSVFVDLFGSELLSIALNQLAHDLTLKEDVALGVHDSIGEVLEWRTRGTLSVISGDKLCLANDLSGVGVDLALLVALSAEELWEVTRHDFTEKLPTVVDGVAGFVDFLALEI